MLQLVFYYTAVVFIVLITTLSSHDSLFVYYLVEQLLTCGPSVVKHIYNVTIRTGAVTLSHSRAVTKLYYCVLTYVQVDSQSPNYACAVTACCSPA